MSDTAIGTEDPRDGARDVQISGIDDEERVRFAQEGGESVLNDDAGHAITREDIEAGNDGNTSADQNNRSPKTNKLDDDGIELGNT